MGAASPVPCARCGAEIRPVAGFCGVCGAARPDLLPPGARSAPSSLFPTVLTFVVAAVVLSAALYILVLQPPATPSPPGKPTVQLVTGSVSSGGAKVFVTSATDAVAITMFGVRLAVEGVSGTVSSFTVGYPVANVTIGGTEYLIYWYDSDGRGTLTPGDEFDVTNAFGIFPSSTSVQFSLLWHDGSTIATAAFQTP